MKNVVIIDLDGTLANIDHRLHFIRCVPRSWDLFFDACDKDRPNEWCVQLICAMLELRHKVKIVTARSRAVEDKTWEWLDKYVPGVELIMLREIGDHRQDDELKKLWLKEQNREEILFVVDDRQRVVDMWRQEGMVCLQCDKWTES